MVKKTKKTKKTKKCKKCRCKPCLCKKDIHCYEIRCDYDPNNPKKKKSRKSKQSKMKKKKKPKQKGGAFCAPCIAAAAPSFPSLAAAAGAAGAAVTGGISVMKRSFSQKVGKQILQGKEEIYEKITASGKKIKKSFLVAKDKKSNKYYVQVGKTKKRFDTYKQALKHFRERIKKCKRLGFEKC